ncbi:MULTISPECIES: helix-turn-helix transcriptional regulator [unclassified Photobacterium]|uniref:helix-turn-helix transcriptional regulator n=1 Tax=unclassified Photobacterium TaxID=2628852 RepID=UPI001EDEEFEA|nr:MULTISPECIES: helix-turn-helix transcriptional regulator [unclassified Photobacterium]MCG3864534.1 helix-turn-helix transcriptional regulator [Photobacterium sp. Ph6]MCG3876058.1 helix-turn-helix transcriptional regulator [Photobacterium sp. Ph5]
MSGIIKLNYYNGNQPQHLRNVPIIYPSIFWIQQGNKQLHWQNDWINFNSHNWLLAHGHTALTFINNPNQTQFFSTQLSFLIRPTDEQIQQSLENQKDGLTPEYSLDGTAKYLWQSIITMPKDIERNVQTHIVNALFEHLANSGYLHQLFSMRNLSWRDKLTQYFNDDPKANHSIESVCDHFGLSKSTLIRRLKEENTQFRDVLAELRMGYALSLLQTKSYSQIELAHLCGYKSEARFAQRFQHQFGLSLKQYQKTFQYH